jgi:hypothetical protein
LGVAFGFFIFNFNAIFVEKGEAKREGVEEGGDVRKERNKKKN